MYVYIYIYICLNIVRSCCDDLRQAQKELHMFMCSGCGYTLFPARHDMARHGTDTSPTNAVETSREGEESIGKP